MKKADRLVGAIDIDRIIYRCPTLRNGRKHPCQHVSPDRRTSQNGHHRRVADISKVVVRTGVCRKNMVLEDSMIAGLQKNHVVIDARGVCHVMMQPDRYISRPSEYQIFLEGDFETPMPVYQKDALRYILNAFDAICKEVPVFLESTIRDVAPPGPFLDGTMLSEIIFPVDWSKDKETWVET